MTSGPRIDITIPDVMNLTSYFLEDNIAKGRANKTAIYYEEEQYTFGDVCALTNRIGNILKEFGVKIEDRVLLILQDCPEWVAGWFAIMKVGGICTHAYTYLQSAGYADFVELVRPKVIIVDDTTLDRVREGIKRTRYSPLLLIAGTVPFTLERNEYNLHEMIKSASDHLDAEPMSKDDIAYWNFSGGTTGKPKAVPHMHRDGIVGCNGWQYIVNYTENDIILNIPKLFFHYAHDMGMNYALAQGSAVILSRQRATASLMFKLAEKHKATFLVNVPTMMRSMIQEPNAKSRDLSSVRLNYSSGEALLAPLYHDWMNTFGIKIANGIGSAETSMGYLSTYADDEETPPGSVGKVFPLTEVKIVDKEGNEVPKGETGTLWVHTDTAGHCYVREHDKSTVTFVGGDWINTDDLFREDEKGYFWYCGRADDMVKISGVFVSPLEIETCIQAHPAVRECAVLGLNDTDGLTKTKAFVALKAGMEPSENMAEELKTYCKKKLASYKSPKVIEFMSELPKTGYNKVDKRRLRERGL